MVSFLEITKSALRRKILAYFFTNPESELYLREIAGLINEDPGNLSKELARLEKEGIFVTHKRGNQKYFSVNKDYPLFKELKGIIFKTIGVKGSVREVLEKISNIRCAFIYGSYAKAGEGQLSDIDLVIIGAPDEDRIVTDLDRLEERLKREINYKLYTVNEFRKAIKEKEPFLIEILKDKKIMLIGNEDELRKVFKS